MRAVRHLLACAGNAIDKSAFLEHLIAGATTEAVRSRLAKLSAGLLLAALYQPVWTSAIHGPKDFGLALVALVALMFWKLPPWLVVLGSGILGGLLSIAL